ncbi:MAG: aminopeptidase P family protein [Planctomycetes bacterium]|nr:aminopeptidase P family protein [Planctomycetota bacterium]MBL7041358.1 aminopeptidase P family protein [Pirellulaceae bacterium]
MPRFHQRRDRLRRLLRKTEADAILVTNFTNVTYLTGFTGDSSFLLLTPKDEIVLSDPRYTQQLGEECPGVDVAIRPTGTELIDTVVKVIKAAKIRGLAIEGGSMTVAFCTELTKKLPKVELASTTNLVEQLREIKDKDEVAEIREAINVAERAFAVVRASLRPERNEKEIAWELENQIRLFGGTRCSFTPIVGVGPRGALPHATLSDHCIAESDFILIDWGAKGRLYVSDLTRVLVTGRISPKLERIYGVVLRAQQAGIAAIKPGAVMKKVDAAARKVIEDAGFGKRFGHGLGHGIGLEVHEGPNLAANKERKLKAGMVVTVEPGIYLPGWGGVRIEDDVLVTRTGHEVLSSVPKEFGDCVL